MKSLRMLALLILVPLSGCLEVEQHPGWRAGEYDGKPDNLPSQAYYSGDRLAWNAAISNRNHLQNEYERTSP
ncbi:hypothetical protein [Noviherbaspirillum aridicola]|uniref:Lipoprotein n=1 Tax=Noviherbaspirillum aridicola TaxID=2849687 RepID=A0ABQ4PZD9_9BURK|nr:hypothetical protein [Noviherbaspirillum aridicola]GIZ50247.1 hypothetical protein NCCP691_02610 [Noviherbaspirillum aridicola]